jgi:ankyrin repeat protein
MRGETPVSMRARMLFSALELDLERSLEALAGEPDYVRGDLLVRAVDVARVDLIELLVARGVPVDMPGMHGIIPLEVACQRGDAAVVHCLLEHGASIRGAVQPGRATPLVHAAFGAHLDVIELLLARGAAASEVLVMPALARDALNPMVRSRLERA